MPAQNAITARKRAAAGVFFILAALGLGVLALKTVPTEGSGSQWSGYRTLLVDASIPETKLLASLSAAGIQDVLSESTEPILVTDWAGLETTTLSSAKARLVPGDPRLDVYLLRLALWFQARVNGVAYRVYYIKESFPFDLGAQLERGLEVFKGNYVLTDSSSEVDSSAGNWIFLSCAAILILMTCAASPLIGKSSSSIRSLFSRRPGSLALDRIAFRISLVLPWGALTGGGLYGAALATLWSFAIVELADGFDMPLDEFRRGRGMRDTIHSLALQGIPPLALPIVAFAALMAFPSMIPSAALALLGSLAAAIGYAFLTEHRNAGRRFFPIPIAGRRHRLHHGATSAGKARATIVLASLLVWGLCRILSPSVDSSSSDVFSPYPIHVHGSLRPLLSEARQRAASESVDVLPGIASYLEHRAVQEALPYIRVGESRPDPFASARLPLPIENASATTAASAQGVEFNDDWARNAYRSIPSLSIEGMLLFQGGATVGKVQSGSGGRGRPLAPIAVLLYILLLVPPIGRILVGVPCAREAVSGELRQEA